MDGHGEADSSLCPCDRGAVVVEFLDFPAPARHKSQIFGFDGARPCCGFNRLHLANELAYVSERIHGPRHAAPCILHTRTRRQCYSVNVLAAPPVIRQEVTPYPQGAELAKQDEFRLLGGYDWRVDSHFGVFTAPRRGRRER